MDRQRLIELLTKRASGIITLPEIRELNEYLKANEDEQQIADALKEVLAGTFLQQQVHEPAAINDRLKKLHDRLNATAPESIHFISKRKHNLRLFIRSIAAALVIGLGIGIVYYYLKEDGISSPSQNILATKKGSKSSLVLPDGTKVLLNADTRLTYDQAFGKKLREVNLEGEAYFEVVKDSKHPFIVHTKAMNVKVLGTVFNVRAYNSESNTAATLLKGSIEVRLNKKSDRNIVVLKPNEKIVVNNSDTANATAKYSQPRSIDISVAAIKLNAQDSSVAETGWTQNRLVFDQAYYSKVFPELERWYGINVIIKDSSILKRKISGIYENESLTEVLESFKLATGFKYKIEDNNLLIYR